MRLDRAFGVMLILVSSLAFSATASAQHAARKPVTPAAATPAAPTPMTNADILGLAAAGLDDPIIIAKIRSAPATKFDTSLPELKALKAGGVSSAVIAVMINPSAPPVAAAPPPTPVATAAPSPDDPDTAHTPGIYILATGKDGHLHLTKLDHISAKQTKTSGAFLSGMTYGIAKAHVKVAIEGDKASIQTTEPNPTFYAYIPEDNNSFGGSALTVKDFTLIKLDPKANTREVNTATISPWGMTSGTDDKTKQGFTSETVKPGVYKLTLARALAPGQYAFQHQNYGAFFDFGIIPNQ